MLLLLPHRCRSASPPPAPPADPWQPTVERHSKNGFKASSANEPVIVGSNVVWLCVKPGVVPPMLSAEKAHFKGGPDGHLVVSICAGVTIAAIEANLPEGTRVVRVMPNTPCLIGETAAGYSPGTHATDADAAVVEQMLSAVGQAHRVPEKLLDAVTGPSVLRWLRRW